MGNMCSPSYDRLRTDPKAWPENDRKWLTYAESAASDVATRHEQEFD
jgi:hypothetical protein